MIKLLLKITIQGIHYRLIFWLGKKRKAPLQAVLPLSTQPGQAFILKENLKFSACCRRTWLFLLLLLQLLSRRTNEKIEGGCTKKKEENKKHKNTKQRKWQDLFRQQHSSREH